jgi:hypothetical protein
MNGPIKTGCCLQSKTMTPIQPNPQIYPISAQHPSLYTAMEHLMIYERWVTDVVLPIAFQWIEANKADVYKNIPPDLQDDVGIVVASAYEIVKSLPKCVKKRVQPQNPVWAEMAATIHDGTLRAFAAPRPGYRRGTQPEFLEGKTCIRAQKRARAGRKAASSNSPSRSPR